MATTYAQQMLDLLSPATRASVLAQVAKDDVAHPPCTCDYHGASYLAHLGTTRRPINPFTHCPCLTSSGTVCGLPFREGECRIHTSYTDSMVIIAAQQAWSQKETR